MPGRIASMSNETMGMHTRLTVLISGNGSNLQALIDACNTPKLPSTSIVRVISNRKNVYGLERANKAGIPTEYHNLVKYKSKYPDTSAKAKFTQAREVYDKDLAALVLKDRPDVVVCAGVYPLHKNARALCTDWAIQDGCIS